MKKLIVAFRNLAKSPTNALTPAAIRILERPGHSSVALLITITRLHFVTVYIIVVVVDFFCCLVSQTLFSRCS